MTELKRGKQVVRKLPAKHSLTKYGRRLAKIKTHVDERGQAWVSINAIGKRGWMSITIETVIDVAVKAGLR